MTPSSLHVPPFALEASVTEMDGPPEASTRLSLPSAKYPTERLVGTYWDIDTGNVPGEEDDFLSYNKDLARAVISRIRTDLDHFTQPEIKVLENHGYLVSNRVIHRHAPELIVNDAPIDVPHEDMMDEDKVRRELEGSDSRFSLKRLFGIG